MPGLPVKDYTHTQFTLTIHGRTDTNLIINETNNPTLITATASRGK